MVQNHVDTLLLLLWTHLDVIGKSVNDAQKKSDVIEGLKINGKNYFGTDKKVTL